MWSRAYSQRRVLFGLTSIGAASAWSYYFFVVKGQRKSIKASAAEVRAASTFYAPPRSFQISRLKGANVPESPFDILIIGGGAVGSGCALDAATRGGMSVACIESHDWASGTSSKSTKLVHGGVRYLEKAIKDFDYEQWKLVKEALRERDTLLKIAPHLTQTLAIMLPVYQ